MKLFRDPFIIVDYTTGSAVETLYDPFWVGWDILEDDRVTAADTGLTNYILETGYHYCMPTGLEADTQYYAECSWQPNDGDPVETSLIGFMVDADGSVSAPPVSLCTLYGTVKNLAGSVVSRAKVSAIIHQSSRIVNGNLISAQEQTAYTSSVGFFSMYVPQTAKVELSIAIAGYSKTIVIPSVSSADFTTL